ncbi:MULTISPECIES: dynamin family protein [Campylobacter]|uniref:dynamin family protein n=1 Tax=Campylobacter TaxID=194 RepID=UPI0023F3E04F|nr:MULTISPECIES: dynamin family protein [Campylobacter]MCI6641518.1 dynamin family protein [Campylobacter sp.]MDD7422053.1 dynamin family protein [Campylobacter hominis]MDY3117238.1 dynamin family protein [Campylobacter hominis]
MKNDNIKNMENIINKNDSLIYLLFNRKNIKKDLKKSLDAFKDIIKNSEEQKKILNQINSRYEAQNSALKNLSLKYTLISKLLSAKLENEGVCKFKEIFEKEFLEFANSDDALPNEAEIVLKLQSMEKELSIIASCPELYKKNIIAVGGGFSAGKSAFINSFLYSKIKLDTNIDPTTALPTYVINSNNEAILGYSKNGGVVNLKEIDENFHTKFSHQFLNSFGFNIKEIMPFMVISTKMKFENICFIDTPGYNPPNINDKYDEDIKISKEFLEEANVFIWLINSENGTIQNSDLDFLTSLNLDNKKLFILVNKADLRSNDDLKDIINEVKESLDDYDIKYEGIQTYASQNNQNHTPIVIKKSLDEFLKENDTISKKYLSILNKLKEIYQIYKNAINEKINAYNQIKNELKSLGLDMLEEGVDDISSKAHTSLAALQSKFNTNKYKENLKKLEIVKDGFIEAVEMIFKMENLKADFNADIAKEESKKKQKKIENLDKQTNINLKNEPDKEENLQIKYDKLLSNLKILYMKKIAQSKKKLFLS